MKKTLPKPKPRPEFLKGSNLQPLLNKSGKVVATIAGLPSEGNYGLDVPLRIGKADFILTLDLEGSSYGVAHAALGSDEADWVKGTITLGVEVSRKTGNPYVVVLEAEAA